MITPESFIKFFWPRYSLSTPILIHLLTASVKYIYRVSQDHKNVDIAKHVTAILMNLFHVQTREAQNADTIARGKKTDFMPLLPMGGYDKDD